MKEIPISGSLPVSPGDRPGGRGRSGGADSFTEFLRDSIAEVDRLQKEAGRAAEELAAGRTENIHETMIALKKAEISFKMMMQIRNKIVKAYEEVMRMQI